MQKLVSVLQVVINLLTYIGRRVGEFDSVANRMLFKHVAACLNDPSSTPPGFHSVDSSGRGETCFPILLAIFLHLFGSERPTLRSRLCHSQFL